ncbi:MAG: AAA family ATPase, partial [Anaerolineae bacterium]|nr:AAA family ATPase [Anaerolineae bacterium]
IKPENIIIKNNVVKLTDFGLATLMSLLAEKGDNYIFGTPSYMPPEQIAGEGIDGRTDLYALGVTLFEMVTGGHLPFNYESRHDIMMAHIDEEPPSVRTFEPSVPIMLERIINKLMAKHSDDRYPSAEAVLDLFKSMQARQKFTQRYMQWLDPDARPLVDRKAEMIEIEAAWQETLENNTPQLLVVQGDMGVGKSRLIAEFLGNSVIDKGRAAVAGRCDETGAAYTPFSQILATIFDQGLVSPSFIETKIDTITDQMPSLAPLLNIEAPKPEKKVGASFDGLWKTLSDRVPDKGLEAPIKSQWQFFATVAGIFVELGPTALYLDDADVLDESSAALLRFLIRQGSFPLFIIAEVSDEPASTAWLNSLNDGEKTILSLKPLPATVIQDYLTNYLGQPVSKAVANIVEKRARGIPFYIEEFTRQLIETGDFYLSEEGDWRYNPPDDSISFTADLVSPFLQSALTRRLEKISDDSRQLLTRAALIEPGPEFYVDIWVELLGGENMRDKAQAALDEAIQRRLLRDLGNNQYAFRPADIATALANTIPPEERRKLHRQTAEILIENQSDPLLIGYHFEQSGLATESAHY